MKVDFHIDDIDVIATCACGWHSHGDSAIDAFRSWWAHKYEKHAEED